MLCYRIPKDVYLDRQTGLFFVTPQGGQIATDEPVARIWEYAGDHDLDATIDAFSNLGYPPDLVRSVVGCLAEAGLLERLGEEKKPGEQISLSGKSVSAVILGFNDKPWLEKCISSLLVQTYTPVEIIVVDNASLEPLEPWLKVRFPQVKTISLPNPLSYAAANNRGIESAKGEYYLLLNQDTYLEPDAVAQMVSAMDSGQGCVCVAPKLRFSWAPAFLNGIGNRSQIDDYGTDNAIGHLDLGQFDGWDTLPSACFAAALISREAWHTVGPMDESFPMYYEDVEWGYRARLLGNQVKFAPKAVVYHGFGGSGPVTQTGALSSTKLYHITYGRYRFTLKLLSTYQWKLLPRYIPMDFARFVKAVLKANWATAGAYLRAWKQIIRDFPSIRRQHRDVVSGQQVTEAQLFAIQADYPPNALWNGLPDLRLQSIQQLYLPLLKSGKTRPVAEF